MSRDTSSKTSGRVGDAGEGRLPCSAERALAELPEALLILAASGEIAFSNRAAERLLGWPQAALIGQPIEALIAPPMRERHRIQREAATMRPGPHPGGFRPHRVMRRDGSFFLAEIIHGGLEEGGAVAVLLRDASDRLAQESLLFARKSVDSQQLASAALAHEISNPLGAVSPNLELAMEALGSGAKDSRELAMEALGDARLGLAQASRVLEQFRGALGPTERAQGEPEGTELSSVVAMAMRLGQRLGGGRAQLRLEEAATPAVGLPSIQLLQVLLNLLKNATEAIPADTQGNIVVRIGTLDDGAAWIEVEDDGHGIDPHTRSRIFDPFFSTKASGSGLGLAISRSLIEAVGGELSLREGSGAGSCFRIILPARA